MADLIDRQAAIDALHMHLMYRMGTDSNKKRLDEWINNLPPAQSEIIRCKDCRYASPNGKYGCRLVRFSIHDKDKPLFSDDFCSKAERRENG